MLLFSGIFVCGNSDVCVCVCVREREREREKERGKRDRMRDLWKTLGKNGFSGLLSGH
jgi:hypothetical protein